MTAPLREVFKNNASTTLDGGIDDTQTSFDVTSGAVFPSTGNFRVIVGAEIMLCTARSSNTLTVVRGAESTTPDSHSDLDTISLVLTNGSAQQWGVDNYGLWNPSRPPFGIYNSSGVAITSSSFTSTNIGAATVADNGQTISISDPARASGEDLRLLTLAAPGTPYSLIAAFSGTALADTNTEPNFGLCFRNSTSAKVSAIAIDWRQTGVVPQIAVFQWTNSTTFSSVAFARRPVFLNGSHMWLKIEDNGTNTKYHISSDAILWMEVYSESRSSFFSGGNTPNQVGIYANNAGGSATNFPLNVRCESFSFV